MNYRKLILVGSIALLAVFLSSNRVAAINEDQIFICDSVKCMITDLDDFFTGEQIDNLDTIFNEDLDTFDLEYLTGDYEN